MSGDGTHVHHFINTDRNGSLECKENSINKIIKNTFRFKYVTSDTKWKNKGGGGGAKRKRRARAFNVRRENKGEAAETKEEEISSVHAEAPCFQSLS